MAKVYRRARFVRPESAQIQSTDPETLRYTLFCNGIELPLYRMDGRGGEARRRHCLDRFPDK
jgi:hypothetical protein